MNENKAVDVKNIKAGDRVLVSGCGDTLDDAHWGTTIEPSISGDGWYVDMDDTTLELARAYFGAGEGGAYYALDNEILQHIPKNKVAMHEGRTVNVEDHGQPNPLAKVIADLTDTHRYLQQVTGKTFEAAIQGFELEVSGDYNSHSVTLRFVEKDK